MLKTLIELYSSHTTELVSLESQKQKLELANIDLESKETMTKMLAKLTKENSEYEKICSDIKIMESKLAIVDKKLSIAKAMIPLFKEYSEFERWLSHTTEVSA